jgi:serine/threonine protein kinase
VAFHASNSAMRTSSPSTRTTTRWTSRASFTTPVDRPRTATPSSATSHRLPLIDSFINREIGERYRIEALCGEGAHARVYRAWDAVRKGRVALKIFNDDALDAQEAEAARNFEVWEGTSILPLLEVHPDFLEGQITVMPLMSQTLADIDQFFASQALYYTRRVLTALEFCHGRGVVHGDVKPSNVFLNETGAAFLGDFGVRDFLNGGRRGHTLEYAAPELLADKPRSAATDVWAAAVMLYELLCRQLPFGSRADEPADAIAARIVAANFKPPDHIQPYLPLRVRHLFEKVFVPDVASRDCRTADALRLALPELDIRAEWLRWAKEGYLAYWEGYEVAAGERTGVRYLATVRERPRLGKWQAEVKRAQPGRTARRWSGIAPFQGTKKEAQYRIALWMRNITTGGAP